MTATPPVPQARSSERVRVLSNYIRLIVTFGAGLLIVRLMAEIGASALVLYLLILAGTGFAQAFKIIVQESVIPVLGLSYDGKSGRPFEGIYWFSMVLSLAAGGLALLIYGIIWLFGDYLDFGDLSGTAFAIALASAAVRTGVSSAATPPLNAILISGRVVAYNVILASERLADLVAVLFVLWVLSASDMATQIIWFFVLSAALYSALQLICYLYATRIDARFKLTPAPLSVQDRSWVGKVFGWNTAVVIAFILYLRFSTFLINGTYGQGPTLVLGLVFLLIGYQRQISMGLVIGLDAAVSRLVGGALPDGKERARALLMRSTYIQAVFSFVSLAVLFLFVEPIFELWFGDSLEGGDWDVGQAATLFRIMAIGVLARSLSEAWMKFLGGQGLVGKYAGILLAAATANAVIITLIATMSGWDAYDVMISIAIVFSIFYVLVHMGAIPVQLARSLEIRPASLYLLLALPVLVVGAATGVSVLLLSALPVLPGAVLSLVLLGMSGAALLLPRVVQKALALGKGTA